MALHEREAEVASVGGIGSARVGHSCVADARVHGGPGVDASASVGEAASVGRSRVERSKTRVDERRHRSAAEREEGHHQRALHRHSAAGLFNDAVMLRTTERGDSRSDWYAR